MGNNSNTQTLRLNLIYNNNCTVLKYCLYNLKFINNLSRSLLKKQVFLINYYISNQLDTLELSLHIFFRTRKLINYKKLNLKTGLKKNKLCFSRLLRIFEKKRLKNLKLKIIVLNKTGNLKYKNKTTVIKMYKNFKSFKLKLFNKNFNLFFDFIKLTVLFLINKTNLHVILYVLSLIFCFLQKRAHNVFLFFLKTYFTFLLTAPTHIFKGFKFLISGKISGKTRSSFKRIQVGSVSVQSIKDNIEYSKLHVYTRYGTFGFKLWASLY